MNCDNFSDQLPEYLDGTLDAEDQAAAREHAENCGDCQRTLARQEAFARSIRISLNHRTEGLSLSTEARRNIAKALEREGFLATVLESTRAFFAASWRRPAWAGVILLGLLALVFGSHFYRHPAVDSGLQITAKDHRHACVINIPIQTETHVERNQNNMAVDAVVIGTSIIDLSFADDDKQSP